MKRVCVLLMACMAALLLSVPVFAAKEIVEPADVLYVSDYADVLSVETEAEIVSDVLALKGACGGEIAVVTIDFLTNGLDSEEYAYEIINQWGVGDEEKQNGCVLLLVVGEGKGWCTVGTGAEKFLSAGRLEQILNDYLWDNFDAGRYDEAVSATVAALLQQYESNYGISVDGQAAQTGTSYPQEEYEYVSSAPQQARRSVSFGEFLFVVILIFLILRMGSGRTRRRRFVNWFVSPRHYHHHHHTPPPGGFGDPPHGGYSHRSPPRTGPGGFGSRSGGFGGGGRSGGSFGGGGGRGGGAGRR